MACRRANKRVVARRLAVIFAWIATAVLLVGPRAFAQSAGGTNQAAAQSLFEEGRQLMNAGKYAEACPKLAESQRLDPGGGTLLNLALCHEQIGKTASAWAEFNDALALALRDSRDVRVRIAREHIAALEPKLSRLTVRPPPRGAINRLELRLDGVVLGEVSWGTPTPVDPGHHRISVSAPGYHTWNTNLEVEADGARVQVDVPVLERLPPPPAPPPTVARSNAPRESDRTRKIVGYSLLGTSAVALGTGAAFGLLTISNRSASDRECRSDNACSAQGVSLNQTAVTQSWVSTAAFGVGAVAAVAGGYLLWSAARANNGANSGSTTRKTGPVVLPQVGSTGGGVSVFQTW